MRIKIKNLFTSRLLMNSFWIKILFIFIFCIKQDFASTVPHPESENIAAEEEYSNPIKEIENSENIDQSIPLLKQLDPNGILPETIKKILVAFQNLGSNTSQSIPNSNEKIDLDLDLSDLETLLPKPAPKISMIDQNHAEYSKEELIEKAPKKLFQNKKSNNAKPVESHISIRSAESSEDFVDSELPIANKEISKQRYKKEKDFKFTAKTLDSEKILPFTAEEKLSETLSTTTKRDPSIKKSELPARKASSKINPSSHSFPSPTEAVKTSQIELKSRLPKYIPSFKTLVTGGTGVFFVAAWIRQKVLNIMKKRKNLLSKTGAFYKSSYGSDHSNLTNDQNLSYESKDVEKEPTYNRVVRNKQEFIALGMNKKKS